MNSIPCWNILIVDDDAFVHENLQMNLRDLSYDDKPANILSAYSSEEAKKMLQQQPDIAVIILDVMMEQEDSGLKFINYVREEIKNENTLILLHTGQPGLAPKKAVCDQYIIDGYLDKNSIDNDDSYVSIKMSLKAYQEKLQLKANAEKNDVQLYADIAVAYLDLIGLEISKVDQDDLLLKVNDIVHFSQKILASYALNDMKNKLASGTTKAENLSSKEYSALVHIYDIQLLLTYLSPQDYAEEKSIIFETIIESAQGFATIGKAQSPEQQRLIAGLAEL